MAVNFGSKEIIVFQEIEVRFSKVVSVSFQPCLYLVYGSVMSETKQLSQCINESNTNIHAYYNLNLI
jgi:hypothetical protein